MAQTPNFQRQLGESAQNLYINRWWSGEVTQRSPLVTPVSSLGLQIVSRHDTLWSGSHDMELTNATTLARRYGHSKFCSQAFGSSDYPLAFYSFKNTSGTIKLMADTPTEVATFSSSAITSLYSKGTTVQSSFQKVGSTLYICDGTNQKKWDQTTVSGWGIAAPATAATISFGAGSLSPKSGQGYIYVYVYKNSTSGHISTASPSSAATGPLTSQHIVLHGSSSADGQVDKVDIYRTLDGGGVFYYLVTINNGGTWTYTDNTADSGLNTDLQPPLSHLNDPPPATLDLVTWHQDRLFGAAGQFLYFSAGPDCTNGVPEEAWPPANVFKLPDPITAMASTTMGLLLWTSSDMFVMNGTDTLSFWVQPIYRNFGVQSQNCVAQEGDTVFMYSSKAQLWVIQDGNQQEIGYAVGDQLLANFPPASSYLALHRSGTDVGLFISNGTTLLKKFSNNYNAWCPSGTISGGIKAIKSIETTTANWQLLVGRAAGSGYILDRDLTTFTDDGTAFTCGVVIGSLVTAPPGSLSKMSEVLVQAMPIGTFPTVGILMNEISGTFTTLPNPVDDPPIYSGTVYASTSELTKRHYLKAAQKPLPEHVQHLQIQLTFPAENARNEVLGVAIG